MRFKLLSSISNNDNWYTKAYNPSKYKSMSYSFSRDINEGKRFWPACKSVHSCEEHPQTTNYSISSCSKWNGGVFPQAAQTLTEMLFSTYAMDGCITPCFSWSTYCSKGRLMLYHCRISLWYYSPIRILHSSK